ASLVRDRDLAALVSRAAGKRFAWPRSRPRFARRETDRIGSLRSPESGRMATSAARVARIGVRRGGVARGWRARAASLRCWLLRGLLGQAEVGGEGFPAAGEFLLGLVVGDGGGEGDGF